MWQFVVYYYLISCLTYFFYHFSISGLAPFTGETNVETLSNVTQAVYDFDDETFEDISDAAKDFISKLLVKKKE